MIYVMTHACVIIQWIRMTIVFIHICLIPGVIQIYSCILNIGDYNEGGKQYHIKDDFSVIHVGEVWLSYEMKNN